jgi:RNA polymerase sigma-70 factor (family 1)
MLLEAYADSELLELLKQGDHKAFTEIYSRYWKSMLTVAANKTGDVDEAEEIVQNIFVSIWNRRKELEIRTSLKSYLSVSVKYQVMKVLANQHLMEYSAEENIGLTVFHDYSAQYWLEFEELQEQLSELVGMLPDKCRLVFRLSRDLGYSQKEIAAELGISEKTVEAHLGKALKTLRQGLHYFMMF